MGAPRQLLVCALALVLTLVGLLGCQGQRGATRLRLATTTSTHSSGLLAALLPPFEEREGITVETIPAGTGQALALGERGDVDLVLVHARAREDAFMAAGHGLERRDVMWNDFVIVGPPADPAGVKGTSDAAAALAAIAKAGAGFVSRGDDSGTHIRERALWDEAGGRASWSAYVEAGQGQGACLTIADQTRAYMLTDRGTYLAFRGELELEVLVEGDPALRNPYGAMVVNPDRHPKVRAELARRLLDYMTSAEGQRRIAEFRVDGEVLFHPARGA